MELLVNLREPTDPLHYHVGDVIVFMPDGHQWTRIEMEREDWVVLRAPVLATHTDVLGMQEYNLANEVVRLRKHRFDMTKVPHFAIAKRRGKLNNIVQTTRLALENATVTKDAIT